MIRHCVFVKFQPAFSRAERDALHADLERLMPKLPGMRTLAAGINVNPEGLGHGFDDGFLIDFDDAGARDAYLVHPDHQADRRPHRRRCAGRCGRHFRLRFRALTPTAGLASRQARPNCRKTHHGAWVGGEKAIAFRLEQARTAFLSQNSHIRLTEGA